MIVDATCAPSNIRYPQDVSLLNEARENAEKLLDILHDPTDGKKLRTYRKRARKIVRGKAGKPVEFGGKLDISVVDGWTRLECY